MTPSERPIYCEAEKEYRCMIFYEWYKSQKNYSKSLLLVKGIRWALVAFIRGAEACCFAFDAAISSTSQCFRPPGSVWTGCSRLCSRAGHGFRLCSGWDCIYCMQRLAFVDTCWWCIIVQRFFCLQEISAMESSWIEKVGTFYIKAV